jgi:peptidoglycan/xylan/chitin deacetylase (PgdA/CDA1 family)
MTSVCLTFDFDALSLWIGTFKQRSATPVSRGEFGGEVGIVRVLDLLALKSVKATFFVPAHTAVAFPGQTRRIIAEGHEIALHGDCHETPVGLSREREAELLDISITRLQSVLGADFRPLGYRSPAWDLSHSTVDLLLERGLVYDSSMMASDFMPYLARSGDLADEHVFRRGSTTALVEIPVAWELDDFPYFNFTNRPLFGGLRSPDDVFNCWMGEFDYCHGQVQDGVFTLTMHPQIIGRGPRIQMLGHLIDQIQAQPGVRFRTVLDAARHHVPRLRAGI